ncbi:hypothetical protein BUE80_DR009209, partial [Diplocarpon rosae]
MCAAARFTANSPLSPRESGVLREYFRTTHKLFSPNLGPGNPDSPNILVPHLSLSLKHTAGITHHTTNRSLRGYATRQRPTRHPLSCYAT